MICLPYWLLQVIGGALIITAIVVIVLWRRSKQLAQDAVTLMNIMRDDDEFK